MNCICRMSFIAILILISSMFFKANSQEWVIKTNLPYLISATPNIGAEYALNDKLSIELSTGINPFKFGADKQIKHWVIWPELRYWTFNTFNGHFFGLHGVVGEFNVSGFDFGIDKLRSLKNNRYEGNTIGVGISYGYHWILNSNWAIELTAGVGMARFNYDTFSIRREGQQIGVGKKNYYGPTKGALSLIYLIK